MESSFMQLVKVCGSVYLEPYRWVPSSTSLSSHGHWCPSSRGHWSLLLLPVLMMFPLIPAFLLMVFSLMDVFLFTVMYGLTDDVPVRDVSTCDGSTDSVVVPD